MRLMDKQHTNGRVQFGQINMIEYISEKIGIRVNRKRIQRLMRLMGIEGEYEKPRTTKLSKEHTIYPYLLRDRRISEVDEVWSVDITYIPMRYGFMYLVAIIDWYSRYIISWELSNTLELDFCIIALLRSLKKGKPKIFNSDQGSQFTSKEFTRILEMNNVQISMDGRGRSIDNVFIERFWRTLKYEEVYKNSYETSIELYNSLRGYIQYYNKKRKHQSLGMRTPNEIYLKKVD
jgi:putative transposase